MRFSVNTLFRRQPKGFTRAAARYSCQINGSMMMIDRMIAMEGRITDFSVGGALFRPRLAYLLARRDVPICLTMGEVEIFGRIVGTSPAGYGLRFDDNLTDDEVQALLALDLTRKSEQPVFRDPKQTAA
jgi:hypothetical protein